MKSRAKPLAFAALVLALLAAGQILRARTGLAFDADSIRTWVDQQGWLAPLTFIFIVALRQFILLPSALLLSAGGLLFGAILGSVFGAVGLAGSAALTFGLARGLGGENVREHVAKRLPTLDRYIESAGPLVVFATVAYPAGLMTPVFWAAGFSSMRFAGLLVAVALGGIIRAASYSFFGSTLLDIGSTAFWLATLALGAAVLLPLAHPGFRRRLLRPAGPPNA